MIRHQIKPLIRDICQGIFIGLIIGVALTILLKLPLIPYTFDLAYGDKMIGRTIANISLSSESADDFARGVMNWERNLYAPYSAYDANSTLSRWGIFKVGNSYKIFYRGAPASWIAFYKMANCGEYSLLFAELMDKKGFKVRMIEAVGEDHAWAEYYSDGAWVVVDPSNNKVVDKKTFEEGRNWSYVQSTDLHNVSDKKDVSDEYIERGLLKVYVYKKGIPVSDIEVSIKSPHLMTADPRYKKPIWVSSNRTNAEGFTTFQLGAKQYVLEMTGNYFFSKVYSKNATVTVGEENNMSFSLDTDTSNFKFFK